MLDIETVSTHRTRAVIVSWCATQFNVFNTLEAKTPLIGLSHHGWPSIRQQFAAGRHVDMNTVRGGSSNRQRRAMRGHACRKKGSQAACEDLASFVGDREVWAHGIGFDVTNVETLFEDAGVKVRGNTTTCGTSAPLCGATAKCATHRKNSKRDSCCTGRKMTTCWPF
jgi:hypothetical protein